MSGFFPNPILGQKYDIPFVPSMDEKVRIMVELAAPLQGKKTIDLGCGDGRVVIAFAKNGARATGIEIDPGRARTAAENARYAGLNGKAVIRNQSFWEVDLGGYDIATLYGITSMMERLERKIGREGQSGLIIISNTFTFPHWTPILERENVYVYRKL